MSRNTVAGIGYGLPVEDLMGGWPNLRGERLGASRAQLTASLCVLWAVRCAVGAFQFLQAGDIDCPHVRSHRLA